MNTPRKICSVLLAATALSACTSNPYGLNDELSVGEGDPRREPYLPESYLPGLGKRPEPTPGPEPSVVAIDRNNWEITRVTVPNDRASHQPIYTRNLQENTEIARNLGLYPTAVSANQSTHPTSSDAQILEAVEAPFAAAADIILFLPRAVMNAPWDPVRTGFEPYRRVPAPRASVSTVLAAPAPTAKTGKPGMFDPAAAPVQVPVGEYLPASPAPGTTQPR